ncbi:MAG: hypothetical protein ACJ74O_20355 [Frankiaceae bacterium]
MRLAVGASVVVLLAVAACGQASTSQGSGGTPGQDRKVDAGARVVARPAATRAPAPTPAPIATTTDPASSEPPEEHLTQPIAMPRCPHSTPSPHFTTAEAMMRYLASAWNRRDLDQLCHVTNPNARSLLAAMHAEAVNLRLNHCEAQVDLTYVCYLDHDYPASMHGGHARHGGQAVFRAAAAGRPGWYMTVFESCG